MNKLFKRTGKRMLSVMLAIMILLGMISMGAMTALADSNQGPYTLHFASNNQEEFLQLFNSDAVALEAEKQQGQLDYNIPMTNANRYYLKPNGNGASWDGYGITINQLPDNLVSVTFSCGDFEMVIPVAAMSSSNSLVPGIGNPDDGASAGGLQYRLSGSTLYVKLWRWAPTDDVTFSFNFHSDSQPAPAVSSNDDSMGTVWAYHDCASASNWHIYAQPAGDWYRIAYWEYAVSGNAFQKLEGSEGKTYMEVLPEEGMSYRAVFEEYSYVWLTFTSNDTERFASLFETFAIGGRPANNIAKEDGIYKYKLYTNLPYTLTINMGKLSEEDVSSILITSGQTSKADMIENITSTAVQVPIDPASPNMLTYNKLAAGVNKDKIFVRTNNLLATEDITIQLNYAVDSQGSFTVTASSADESQGKANSPILTAVNSYILTSQAQDGYVLDFWEYKGASTNNEWVKDDDSNGKSTYSVTVTEEREYRAVFASTAGRVDLLGNTIGIHEMVHRSKPTGLMWNNHPGPLPKIEVLGSNQSFFFTDATLAGYTQNQAPDTYTSDSVKSGSGAAIWFKFKTYDDLENVKVSLYTGNTADESALLYRFEQDALNLSGTTSKGYGYCRVPVNSMPYTQNITVVFEAGGKTFQKTYSLAAEMTDSGLYAEKSEAMNAIEALYAQCAAQIKESSITYEYSSQWLLLNCERLSRLDAVEQAETASEVAKAREIGLQYLRDTANGIYHQGVDVGITVKDSMQVVRVPEISCIFDAMCAALEQAYPDGHWYYSVGSSQFGIYFNNAGYLEDNTDRPGVRMDGGTVGGGYGVSDYKGDRNTGMANGVSNQCVWEGICTGTPNRFDADGSPETLIKLNRSNKNDVTWNLARLLQHYSAEDLLANEIYSAALQNQNNDEDGVYDKSLRIEYVDFFLCEETQAVRDVIKMIGALSAESSWEDLEQAQSAYNALSDEEKPAVFNYDDLLPLIKKGEELAASLIDLQITNLGQIKYTAACRQAISAARQAYDAASDNVKALITQLDALKAAETAFNTLASEMTAAAEDAIKALPDTITYPDGEAAVNEAQEAYDALLEAEKNSFDSALKNRLAQAQSELAAAKTAYYAAKLNGAKDKVISYIFDSLTQPAFGNEWMVLAQARDDANTAQYYTDYYNRIVEYVQKVGSGKLADNKSTENSRLILVLSAMGKDAKNVGGYDLITPYGDFDWVIHQGINGALFALLALDSGNYAVPYDSDAQIHTTRDMLVEYILAQELESGGWALFGSKADPDITAMALQALALYKNDVKVAAAIEHGLDALSELQQSNGGYISWGTENVESTAQVIIALTALGIDPVNDARFIKNGANLFTALLPYQLENGAFEHTAGGGADSMATEQSALALVAYDRFLKGESSLYNISGLTAPPSDAAENPDDDVQTGDIGSPYIMIAGVLLSLTALFALSRRKKRSF